MRSRYEIQFVRQGLRFFMVFLGRLTLLQRVNRTKLLMSSVRAHNLMKVIGARVRRGKDYI